MKTIYKAAIAVIVAVFLGLFFRSIYLTYTGQDGKGLKATVFHQYMIEAKEMFLQKSVPIQEVVFCLDSLNGLSIVTGNDGKAYVETEDGPILLRHMIPEISAVFIENTMGNYAVGGKVYNIEVTSDAVLVYTKYDTAGCVGFLYEKVPGGTQQYKFIDLAEKWKIFYQLDESKA